MKYLINKTTITLLGLVSLICFSCQEDVLGINDDPNIFTEVPGALQLGTAQLSAIKMASSDNSRFSAIFAGHATGAGAQWATTQNYNVTADNFSDLWDDAYQEGVTQASQVVRKAKAAGDPILEGVGLIFEAYHLGELTSSFGDIPNAEAGTPDTFPNPIFDAQAVVFDSVQNKLSRAITLLGATNTNVFNSGLSSPNTWADIARAFSARYYLNAGNYDMAYQAASNVFLTPDDGLFSNHTPAAGSRNFWYQFGVDQRAGNIIASNAYLYDLLDPANTAVSRNLVTPGDADRFTYYFDPATGEHNYAADGVFALDASFSIIDYYELELIRAESGFRSATITEAVALGHLNDARTALQNEFGGLFPPSAAAGSQLLLDIMEEKYITMLCKSQAFHDLARTNNLIGVTPNSGIQLPVRFLYPLSEINNNSNIPATRPDIFTDTPVNL